MENVKLRRLAVLIGNEEREDVVIIFAEPCIKVKYIYFPNLNKQELCLYKIWLSIYFSIKINFIELITKTLQILWLQFEILCSRKKINISDY